MARVNATGKESASNFSPDNGTGLAVRTAMKDIFESLRTLNSAAGDPTGAANLAAYQLHINTTENPPLLKMRNGANSAFITIGDVTETNLGLLPRTGGSTAPMTGQFLAHNHTNSESTPDISFAVDTDTGFYRSANNTVGISCAGSNRFNFNTTSFESKSDIEIAKTGSDAYLQINSDASYNAYLDFSTDATTLGNDFGLRLIRGAGATGDSILLHRSSDTNNGSLLIQNQNPNQGNIAFSTGGDATTTPETAPIERWKIEHSGSLTSNGSLATNALTTAGACFNIQTTAFEGLTLVKNGTGYGTALFIHRLSASGTGNLIEFQYNNSAVGNINTNGSTVTYNPPSDYRLKQDVSNIDDAITKIKALRPVLFRWKNNPDLGYDNGFIAHEVQETGYYDHIVTGVKDGTKKSYSNPEENEPDYQGLDYSRFTPMLVAALQEAVAKIETLETKVAALEAS